MLARCTSSLDLHMLIVPFWYFFLTLLVPKVATGGTAGVEGGSGAPPLLLDVLASLHAVVLEVARLLHQ